jgi:hypothetical protein
MVVMNWGNKIIVVLTLFVGGIGYMVYICMKQKDMELVSRDYYEQEIAYQEVIDKQANYHSLAQKPRIKQDITHGTVLIDFSTLEDYKDVKGRIRFFRPSKSALDFQTDIQLDENGCQQISTEVATQGKWIVKLEWSDDIRSYYSEQVLWIQ